MAWRLEEHVVRGEIDNREKGRVTGKIWFLGRDEPVLLDLVGNCRNDMAGCLLTFTNTVAKEGDLSGFAELQNGICGDMTASRKVKIPTISMEEYYKIKHEKPMPYRWGNVLYLEWYSQFNGRVVIEAVDFEQHLTLPQWRLTAEDEEEQKHKNLEAMNQYMAEFEKMLEESDDEVTLESSEFSESESNETSDASEEEAIDRILRINDLKHEAEELAGGPLVYQHSEDVPPEVEEQFWENVVDIEKAPTVTRRELLKMDGFEPKTPSEIPDENIEPFLWELIEALADRRHFLEQTDHLSDRELYIMIFDRILEEETQVLNKDTAWCFHIIVSEYGSLDGEVSGDEIFFRYYADDEWREEWSSQFDSENMPTPEKPPYNRDHKLPSRESRDERGEE